MRTFVTVRRKALKPSSGHSRGATYQRFGRCHNDHKGCQP